MKAEPIKVFKIGADGNKIHSVMSRKSYEMNRGAWTEERELTQEELKPIKVETIKEQLEKSGLQIKQPIPIQEPVDLLEEVDLLETPKPEPVPLPVPKPAPVPKPKPAPKKKPTTKKTAKK